MTLTDLPVIDSPFANVLAPGMECRGKGVLFVIWWPRHGLHVALTRKEATRDNIMTAVSMLQKAAAPF